MIRQRAEAAGCAAVLLKPVLPDTLVAVLQQVVLSPVEAVSGAANLTEQPRELVEIDRLA